MKRTKTSLRRLEKRLEEITQQIEQVELQVQVDGQSTDGIEICKQTYLDGIRMGTEAVGEFLKQVTAKPTRITEETFNKW